MKTVLDILNEFLWGFPVLIMILGTGIYLTVKSKCSQIRLLPSALLHFFKSIKRSDRSEKCLSGYNALCTALAGTVGIGNIAGVAGAIALGGPGVIFWMWICALLGMVLKFAEVTLAVHYRVEDRNGNYFGGPMYMIRNGLSKQFHVLAYGYCFFGIIASFGIGNTVQINTVISGLASMADSAGYEMKHIDYLLIGAVIASFVFLALKNDILGAGQWASKLVPIAALTYLLLSSVFLILRYREIPNAFLMIIKGAFTPCAVTGGAVGSLFMTIRIGTARGIFTNEAGMGTASIVHSSAHVKTSVEQGLLGIMEVFIDTIVICTLTAMVILCSDVPISYGVDFGIELTLNAFSSVYGDWCRSILIVLTSIFAFATVLGWGVYGGKCAQFLFGREAWIPYVILHSVIVVVGATMSTPLVWVMAEILNALMAIPNLMALLMLAPVFISIIRGYNKHAYRCK